MKKLFLLSALVLVVASGLFIGCQKNEVVNPEEGLRLKSGAIVGDQADCNEVCIDLSLKTPLYYEKSYQETVSWGGNNNDKFTKVVDLVVYNTDTHFIIKFKSTHSPQNLYIDGILTLEYNGAVNTWVEHSIALEEGWQACDPTEYAIVLSGQGPEAAFEVSYNLIGLCGCEESFTSVDNGDKTYTFTYTPEVDMAGAELVFTFAQSAYVSGLPEGWAQAGQGQTMHATMDLTACEVYTWTVTLAANCSGGSGKSNVWTDFKVNDFSKKNNTEDKFIQNCE